MNKKILFLHVALIFIISISHAQWQPEIQLTNNMAVSQTSYNNAHCIAADGNFVHAVWYDSRDGNDEIYYKRSTDKGANWSEDIRLTNDTAKSEKPSISIYNSIVHIVWTDGKDGNDEIYYKRSTDKGISWETEIRLTNDTADSWFSSLSISEMNVHVVWEDRRNGTQAGEIYYKKSTNEGITWSSDIQLTIDPSYSRYPSVASNGTNVHVVWYDFRDENYEIYYKRSTDNGISWNSDTRLTYDTSNSISPSIAVCDSTVHVIWTDYRLNGSEEIYYKHSTNNGITWDIDIYLTSDTTDSTKPSIVAYERAIYTVWYDDRDGNNEIYYNHSTNFGNTWNVNERLSNNTGGSFLPSIAYSDSIVHVVWFDFSPGNREILYKRNILNTITSIENISTANSQSEISIYPNPVQNEINVQLYSNNSQKDNSYNNIYNIIIYDIRGRMLVNQQTSSQSASINIKHFSKGIYFIRIKNSSGIEESIKLFTKL